MSHKYGNTLHSIYGIFGIIREPCGQFQALPRNILFDAEIKIRIRFGNCSFSYNDIYDDVSGDFVQYIYKNHDESSYLR